MNKRMKPCKESTCAWMTSRKCLTLYMSSEAMDQLETSYTTPDREKPARIPLVSRPDPFPAHLPFTLPLPLSLTSGRTRMTELRSSANLTICQRDRKGVSETPKSGGRGKGAIDTIDTEQSVTEQLLISFKLAASDWCHARRQRSHDATAITKLLQAESGWPL
eukprot:484485-Rhodomonas_salina.1